MSPTSALKRDATARQLVVFSDDWGRHPSSCQHLVRQLLPDCDVSWVNTIGTRSPRLNWGTLARAWGKLRDWAQPKSSIQLTHEGPRVLSPRMWPGFRTPWQRKLNRRLLAGFLEKHVPQLTDSVLLTTVPIVSDVLDCVSVRRSVYYCVDDFSAWPGLDSGPLRDMERDLVGKVDLVVAAGGNLAQRMRQLGRSDVSVLTHGLDLAHWQLPVTADPLLHDLERPIVLFWGLVDRRLDVKWLESLAKSMKLGTIVLVGPEQDPDPALATVPRLRRLGPVSYERLPAIAAGASVLIMPYADLPVTRAMQPLKLKEYLATGKPVVVRRLPAVEDWEDCVDAVTTAEDFCSQVEHRVQAGTATDQLTSRQRLDSESWCEKAQTLKGILFCD